MRLANIVGVLAAGSVLLLGSACGGSSVTMRPSPRAFTASDYDNIYEAWTREADVFAFGTLTDVLNVTGTFQGWEFRWAYVVRYADDHGFRTEDRADMLRASLADAQQRHRFFVTISGRRWRETDLARDDSAWRVLLVDEEDDQTVPLEVELLHRPGANIAAYYPSVTTFRHAFRIVFPSHREDGTAVIPDNARFVILRFTGPLGTVDLKWEFAHSN
ncbi:MAG: hypothetical protein DRJ42_27150 [Deltaproteobacteria bacterium]|nr:MAG: hypothetical protein DRJ42_27150 [Deltaproteobacteria bacterium]